MNIIENLEWRYATKKFNPTKFVTEEQLLQLKNAFNLTATSYGLQPVKMVIVKNQETREKLVPFAFGQRQVADASHLLVLCIQKEFTNDDIEQHFNLVQKIRNTPDQILAPFKENISKVFASKTAEQVQQASKFQAYLALGNLLTVCASLKIDSCPMEGFLPHKFDETLKLSELNLTSVLLLPIGFRAEDDFMALQKKVRKPLNDSIIEIN
jgi:nitroreductase / dihydropteridine reductase